MIIKNKLHSMNKINELRLNKFPEQLLTRNEEKKVLEFLKDYPAQYYVIRDKSKSGGFFKLKLDFDKILNEIEDYDLFSINVC